MASIEAGLQFMPTAAMEGLDINKTNLFFAENYNQQEGNCILEEIKSKFFMKFPNWRQHKSIGVTHMYEHGKTSDHMDCSRKEKRAESELGLFALFLCPYLIDS